MLRSVDIICKIVHQKSKIKAENEQIQRIVQNSYHRNYGICRLDKLFSDVREKFAHCSKRDFKGYKEKIDFTP